MAVLYIDKIHGSPELDLKLEISAKSVNATLYSAENIPDFMLQFWSENPTDYTSDDILHLEPFSENAVFLKYLALLSNESGNSEQTRGLITANGKDFITSNNLIFTAQG